jgi:hypothetical protein
MQGECFSSRHHRNFSDGVPKRLRLLPARSGLEPGGMRQTVGTPFAAISSKETHAGHEHVIALTPADSLPGSVHHRLDLGYLAA